MSEAELSVKAIQKIVNKLYKRELEFAERRGRVEELTLLLKELVILEDESKLTEISFFKLRKKIICRLKELEGVEK